MRPTGIKQMINNVIFNMKLSLTFRMPVRQHVASTTICPSLHQSKMETLVRNNARILTISHLIKEIDIMTNLIFIYCYQLKLCSLLAESMLNSITKFTVRICIQHYISF